MQQPVDLDLQLPSIGEDRFWGKLWAEGKRQAKKGGKAALDEWRHYKRFPLSIASRQSARLLDKEEDWAVHDMLSYDTHRATHFQKGLTALALHARATNRPVDLEAITNNDQLKAAILQSRVSKKAMAEANSIISGGRKELIPDEVPTIRQIAYQFNMTDLSEEMAIRSARSAHQVREAIVREKPLEMASGLTVTSNNPVDRLIANLHHRGAALPYAGHHEKVSEQVRFTLNGMRGTERAKDLVETLIVIDPSIAETESYEAFREDMRSIVDTGIEDAGGFMVNYGNKHGRSLLDMLAFRRSDPADSLAFARVEDFLKESLVQVANSGAVSEDQMKQLAGLGKTANDGMQEYCERVIAERFETTYRPQPARPAAP
ncbi:MAG: hypothetical protein AAF556_00250 [Pseudomonadota bacterium]